jgi:prevent-host-death family protein
MSHIVNLYDAKTHLSQLVDRAADGEEIIIAKNGTPLVQLVPIQPDRAKRLPAGALSVTFLSSDFDAPLPPDIAVRFEDRD